MLITAPRRTGWFHLFGEQQIRIETTMLNLQTLPKYFKLPGSEAGQDMAEYGMLIAFLALVVIVAVTLLGTNIGVVIQNLAGQILGA